MLQPKNNVWHQIPLYFTFIQEPNLTREFMQLSNEFLPFRARQEARWWTETKS